jgi:hypothetical protein
MKNRKRNMKNIGFLIFKIKNFKKIINNQIKNVLMRKEIAKFIN